jgi:hypothetical protein
MSKRSVQVQLATYLRLKVAQESGSDGAHTLTIPANILAMQSESMEDMEKRTLPLSVSRVEKHMAGDCAWHVEIDLNILSRGFFNEKLDGRSCPEIH